MARGQDEKASGGMDADNTENSGGGHTKGETIAGAGTDLWGGKTVIEVRNLNKSFDSVNAISNVDATIEEGHVFGLIGTNGAGKSTFMRMVSGVLKPDSGDIRIDGEPVYDNPAVKGKLF